MSYAFTKTYERSKSINAEAATFFSGHFVRYRVYLIKATVQILL